MGAFSFSSPFRFHQGDCCITVQLALRFGEILVAGRTQARYHAFDPCLAGNL